MKTKTTSRQTDLRTVLLPIIFVFFNLHAASLPDLSSIMKKQNYLPSEMFNISNFEENIPPAPAQTSYIDNSIDEDQYFIGTGDEFRITIVEMPSITTTVRVNQNGDLYIPKMGILKLGKISLHKAKNLIVEFVKNRLKQKYTVYVSLSTGKKVRVTVNGLVSNPGTFFVDGILRISDCITKANKGIVPLIHESDLRNISVQSQDTTLQFDLLYYYLKNDISQNPYVYPGDIIFIYPVLNRVYVQGEINFPAPGYVPIKKGERLNDFMKTLILSDAADSNMIIVQKGSTSENRYDTIVSIKQDNAIILENADVITIPTKADYPQVKTVFISGAVARPGPYNCIEQVTTVEDILNLCGGPTSKANTDRTYIIRRGIMLESKKEMPKEISTATLPDTKPTVTAGSIRPELNFAFTRLTDFNDFTVISLEENGLNTKLEDDDLIVVPYIEKFVYISGSVNKPGAYPYVKGKNRRSYIRDAGGYAKKADRKSTYVLGRYNTVLQIREEKEVREGDIIVIPDSQRNIIMSQVVIPVIQIVSTLATVVLTIFTISNMNPN